MADDYTNDLEETELPQVYRCACGNDVELNPPPENCPSCNRKITRAASTDLSMSMTISNLDGPPQPNVRDGNQIDPNQLIGKKLGHFKIMEQLGSGGMGQVYRALDTSLQRYVAVKVLRNQPGSKRERNANEHLLQEAIAQARVSHGNVVTIFYVGRHEGSAFLAMELAGSETLAKKLESGPLPYDQIATIAKQVVDALSHSYEMGIIHADIKPSNILLSASNQVKLSDFGMSRRLDLGEVSKATGGTPNYLAPEVLGGEQPTIQSDMYALGVTLFELSFGRLPVQMSGKSVDDWKKAHSESSIDFPNPFPNHLPDRWRSVLARLLAKDPANRFATYEELQNELKYCEPNTNPPARAFPRAIAWMFDFALVTLIAIPFLGFLSMLTGLNGNQFSIGQLTTGSLAFIPMLIYFAILLFWRQSIGRYLMSIRIVNQFGLTPSRMVLFLREVVRLGPLWVLFAFVFDNSSYLAGICQAVMGLVLVVCCLAAVFNRQRKTLYDFAFKTRVVIDT